VKLSADAKRALREVRAARARLETESRKAQDSTAKAVRTLSEDGKCYCPKYAR
jgi:hypothetical protein